MGGVFNDLLVIDDGLELHEGSVKAHIDVPQVRQVGQVLLPEQPLVKHRTKW